ncbi:MAG: rhodanese-like domain-containing protein [Pseudobacteriovorax sp.]|nr:rhodanese-like domain-containing protein [Pseudobacteriovorax sp.]
MRPLKLKGLIRIVMSLPLLGLMGLSVSCEVSEYKPGAANQGSESPLNTTDAEKSPAAENQNSKDNDNKQSDDGLNEIPVDEDEDKKADETAKAERINRILGLVEEYDNGPTEDRTTVEQLKLWIEADSPERPLYIVDSRFIEEFEVSHLPGALHQSVFYDKLDNGEIPASARVVVYCTIGFRSSFFTQGLKDEASVSEVWNLEGSILMWVNQGNAVYTSDNVESKDVHVFDERWDVLPDGYVAVKFPAE